MIGPFVQKPRQNGLRPHPFLGLIPAFLVDGDLINEGIQFRNLPPNYVAWLLIPLGVAVFSWFFYKRETSAPRGMRIFLAILRAAAIFAICLLVFEPVRQFRKVEEIRSLVTVLCDTSSSMNRQDPYDQNDDVSAAVRRAANLPESAELRAFSRTELVKRTLGADGVKLIEKLREKHDVKIGVYDSGKPRPIESFDQLTSEGPITATGDALAAVLADPDIQSKPNTSVILISDGRTNAGTNPADIARAAGEGDKIPIHVIGVGDPDAMKDLELRFIRADEVVLKGNTLKMSLTIKNRGYDAGWITVSLVDQDKRNWISPQRMRIEKTEGDQVLDIDVLADRVGQFTLEARIEGPPGEEDTRNNTKKHTLIVKDEKLRVLYVDTLPRWEYRRVMNFLIRGDDSFVAQCMLLNAEPDFIQEASPGAMPLKEFPAEFEALDKYDVIVFGDVDPNLLVPSPSKLTGMMRSLQKFVDNGGGLVVIAGEGWTPHAYADTTLEEMLPVDIGSSSDFGPWGNYVDEWKPKLTAIGRTHPIMQLERSPEENRRLWEDMSYGLEPLRWWYPVRKASPAAQVLAVHPTQRNALGYYPLIVTGNYGDGSVTFLAIDETWLWYKHIGPVYFNRFWGNIVRQAARSHVYRGSKRFKLVANKSEYQQGETVILTAFAKDKEFEDSTAPTQRIMLVEPDSKGRIVELERVRDGEYSWSMKPRTYGRFDAWVIGDEGVAGEKYAPISFEVTFVDPERQNPAYNAEGLEEIASKSGGIFLRLEESEKVFDRLRADTTRRSKVLTRPLRRQPWLPLIPLVLLTIEWLLRRRYRMV